MINGDVGDEQTLYVSLRRTCETAPEPPHPHYPDESLLADRGKDAVKDLSVTISYD